MYFIRTILAVIEKLVRHFTVRIALRFKEKDTSEVNTFFKVKYHS